MAKTSATRSMEPELKYGGLFLVQDEREPVREPVRMPARERAFVQPGTRQLLPMAFGAMAMPLLWVLGQLLHALHL